MADRIAVPPSDCDLNNCTRSEGLSGHWGIMMNAIRLVEYVVG
jgi:hypothetical protein